MVHTILWLIAVILAYKAGKLRGRNFEFWEGYQRRCNEEMAWSRERRITMGLET